MQIFIDNKSGAPIYDQIYTQIKNQIIAGQLREHDMLLSIRGLAKDLRISFITTRRAYDERSKWDMYCGTLPCTKAEIVSAKYVLGILLQALIILLTAIVQGIQMARTGRFEWNSYLALVQMLLVMGCAATSFTLPFMYKFGVEKGRMAYYVMVVFVSGGSAMAAALFRDWLHLEVAAGLPLVMLTLAAIGAYALSWWLSIRFYEKRDLK